MLRFRAAWFVERSLENLGTHSAKDPASHPKKDVRKVLVELVSVGWSLEDAGHWGTIRCPCGCTREPVPGSPKNPKNWATRMLRTAQRCPLPAGDPRRKDGR